MSGLANLISSNCTDVTRGRTAETAGSLLITFSLSRGTDFCFFSVCWCFYVSNNYLGTGYPLAEQSSKIAALIELQLRFFSGGIKSLHYLCDGLVDVHCVYRVIFFSPCPRGDAGQSGMTAALWWGRGGCWGGVVFTSHLIYSNVVLNCTSHRPPHISHLFPWGRPNIPRPLSQVAQCVCIVPKPKYNNNTTALIITSMWIHKRLCLDE